MVALIVRVEPFDAIACLRAGLETLQQELFISERVHSRWLGYVISKSREMLEIIVSTFPFPVADNTLLRPICLCYRASTVGLGKIVG